MDRETEKIKIEDEVELNRDEGTDTVVPSSLFSLMYVVGFVLLFRLNAHSNVKIYTKKVICGREADKTMAKF